MNPVVAISASCLVAIALAQACRHESSQPVPRRYAYPRVETYPAAYHSVDSLPLNISVNDSARVTTAHTAAGTTWIDVAYPRYNATIRYTLLQASGHALTDAMANRMERVDLDTAGHRPKVLTAKSVANPDIITSIILTPEVAVTPIHIFTSDSSSFMLSGVVEMHSEASAEELQPVIDAITADILHTAQQIIRP